MTSTTRSEAQSAAQKAGTYFIPQVAREKLTTGLLATSAVDNDSRRIEALWEGHGPPAPLQNADPWPDVNTNNPDEQDG